MLCALKEWKKSVRYLLLRNEEYGKITENDFYQTLSMHLPSILSGRGSLLFLKLRSEYQTFKLQKHLNTFQLMFQYSSGFVFKWSVNSQNFKRLLGFFNGKRKWCPKKSQTQDLSSIQIPTEFFLFCSFFFNSKFLDLNWCLSQFLTFSQLHKNSCNFIPILFYTVTFEA